MNFSPEEILQLRRYNQRIIERPRPFFEQPYKVEGIFRWCEDWEIIEILKYMFNGKTAYMGDPPPNRLKYNPLWSKEDIAMSAEALWTKYQSVDAIINHFQDRRANHAPA